MRRLCILVIMILLLVGLVGVVSAQESGDMAGEAGIAEAVILNAAGAPAGSATFFETQAGEIDVAVELSGFESSGQITGHALTINEVGECNPPQFSSADQIVAELPNLQIFGDGSADYRQTVADLNVDSLLDSDGAAIVLYADEERTERIACGVIGRTQTAATDVGAQPPAVAPEVEVTPVGDDQQQPADTQDQTEAEIVDTDAIGVDAEEEDTLGQISDNPSAFMGRSVTVAGGIDELIGNEAFTIANNTLTDDDEILVVGASPEVLAQSMVMRQPVRVSGQVVEFVRADVESEFGLDLNDDLFVDYEGQPAIMAQSVEVIRGNVAVADLMQNAAPFIGDQVIVSESIARVLEPEAFVIGPYEGRAAVDQLLIIDNTGDTPTGPFGPGVPVRVTGEVTRFVRADNEQEFGIDLNDTFYVDFEAQPAIIANSIEVIGAGATLDDISDNPSSFFGERVAVDGGVNVVLNESSFTIASDTLTDDDEILVIGAGAEALATAVRVEEPVRVVGEVVQFVRADVEQNFGIDLDDQLFVDFEGQPAIVAQSVSVIEDAETVTRQIPQPQPGVSAEDVTDATGQFIGVNNVQLGTATLSSSNGEVTVNVQLSGFDPVPGDHALAFTTVGSCQPPNFRSAGEVAVSLPNVQFFESGTADYERTVSDVNFETLFDDNGSALVIYADQETDPDERIACAVVRAQQ